MTQTERGLRRCLACMEPFMGALTDERCPVCVKAGRQIPGWVKAWRRSLQIQGRRRYAETRK